MSEKTPLKKRILVIVGILAIIAAGIALPFLLNDQLWFRVSGKNETAQIEGELAPEFSLEDLKSGVFVDNQTLRGKVVVLQFWATWCPYCKEQMPHIQALSDDPKVTAKAHIIAVNNREKPLPYEVRKTWVQKYLDDSGYTFQTLIGGRAIRDGLKIGSIPAIVVLDPDGRIHYSGLGSHDADRIRDIIDDASGN